MACFILIGVLLFLACFANLPPRAGLVKTRMKGLCPIVGLLTSWGHYFTLLLERDCTRAFVLTSYKTLPNSGNNLSTLTLVFARERSVDTYPVVSCLSQTRLLCYATVSITVLLNSCKFVMSFAHLFLVMIVENI